jgi:hypothetical protein
VAWVKVGTSGELNYLEQGVTVAQQAESMSPFRALGDTGIRKVFRTEEEMLITLQLADLTLEQYLLAMNGNAVTTTAAGSGTAGFKKLPMSRGLVVQQRAILLRGPSPYGDGWNMQYEVPVVVQSGSPQPVFRKNEPASLALEYMAIIDPNASGFSERYGRLIAQHQTAL